MALYLIREKRKTRAKGVTDPQGIYFIKRDFEKWNGKGKSYVGDGARISGTNFKRRKRGRREKRRNFIFGGEENGKGTWVVLVDIFFARAPTEPLSK